VPISTSVQVLRQVRVLHRAEEGRVRAHEEDAEIEHPGGVRREGDRREHHDADLELLHAAHDPRLVELVRELPGGRGEEEEGHDEDAADDEAGGSRIDAAPLGRAIGRKQREGELEEAVVRRAEELRPEEGREAALLEERELAHAFSRM
jgi:hypothetical protein